MPDMATHPVKSERRNEMTITISHYQIVIIIAIIIMTISSMFLLSKIFRDETGEMKPLAYIGGVLAMMLAGVFAFGLLLTLI
jgi:hypothetical protein